MLNKYFEVFRLSFKMQIVWRFDVAMTVVATIGRILAAWILWSAIFSRQENVSGFTLQSMLSYYIISSLLASLDMSDQISGEVSHLIRMGRFSGHMVVPMNPQGFFGSMVAGESAFHLFFSLIAVIACVFLFQIQLVVAVSVTQALLAVVMIMLGLLFMISFQYFLGILTFKFQGITGFLHISNNLIRFATGALVPLALLPSAMTTVMRFLPFYYVTYLPSMLLTGRNGEEALSGSIILACWTAVLLIISQLGYRKLRIRYDGVGI